MVYENDYHGCLVPGEPNRTLIAAMREVIALAQAEGNQSWGEGSERIYRNSSDAVSGRSMPSMRQDGVAHRRSEVDMFAGVVKALADKHHIYVPANEFLYERVKEMESRY